MENKDRFSESPLIGEITKDFLIIAFGNGNPEHIVLVCKKDKCLHVRSEALPWENNEDVQKRDAEISSRRFSGCMSLLNNVKEKGLKMLKITFWGQFSTGMGRRVRAAIDDVEWSKVDFIVLRHGGVLDRY